MRWLTGILLPALVGACTSANLFTADGSDHSGPDRVSLQGRLCTLDTGGPDFKVKVLFLVDVTPWMAVADASGSNYGVLAIQNFLNAYQYQSNLEVGFGTIGAAAAAVTPQAIYYSPLDAAVVAPAIASLAAIQGGGLQAVLDVASALSLAESYITTDIANSTPGQVLRSRYLIFMLLSGLPPLQEQGALAASAQNLKDFVLGQGALELSLNIGHIYFGPQSITAPYKCFYPGPGENCGNCAVPASDSYCTACAALAQAGAPNWATQDSTAQQLYGNMALGGNGNFTEFGCAASVNINLDVARSNIALVKKQIVAFNRNVVLTKDGQAIDSDGDGLTDAEELAENPPLTDPYKYDTSGLGLGDKLQIIATPGSTSSSPSAQLPACKAAFICPSNPGATVSTCPNGGYYRDTDGDMLNDCEEQLLQTSVSIPDTDGDGYPDMTELYTGTDPTSPEDPLLDFDGDGILNGLEVLGHTNARQNDVVWAQKEGYRNDVSAVGISTVAAMENPAQLVAVTFVDGSANLTGGPAFLGWCPAGTAAASCLPNTQPGCLTFSDTCMNGACGVAMTPVPAPITGTGTYHLVANQTLGGQQLGQIYIDVSVDFSQLQSLPSTVDHPLISISNRNCYDVLISNIKILPTHEAVGFDGTPSVKGQNNIYVFFTQTPTDRLDAPGIDTMATIKVYIGCTDPNVPSSCKRVPAESPIAIQDSDFVSTTY